VSVPQAKRFSVGVAEGDGWSRHSDHGVAQEALTVAAELRAQGIVAHAFDWNGEAPAGTLLDPDHSADDRCRAHFWQSESRCEHAAGHEGMHTVRGFASWGEDLSVYRGETKLSGGLLDLLEEAR
jgi:hypothetical protein